MGNCAVITRVGICQIEAFTLGEPLSAETGYVHGFVLLAALPVFAANR